MPVLLQFSCQVDGFGTAPAVSIDDDAGVLPLGGGKSAVVVRIEQVQNPVSGSSFAIALKGLHLHSLRISLAQARRELYLAVSEVIVSDEPAHKPDNDCRRRCANNRRRSRLCRIGPTQSKHSYDPPNRSSGGNHCAVRPARVGGASTDFSWSSPVSTACQWAWSFLVSIGAERSQ